jgi:hypothetical protein
VLILLKLSKVPGQIGLSRGRKDTRFQDGCRIELAEKAQRSGPQLGLSLEKDYGLVGADLSYEYTTLRAKFGWARRVRPLLNVMLSMWRWLPNLLTRSRPK